MGSDDVYYLTPTTRTKLDRATRLRKQGVVFATSDVQTWVKMCATLTNDYFAGLNKLTAKSLDT